MHCSSSAPPASPSTASTPWGANCLAAAAISPVRPFTTASAPMRRTSARPSSLDAVASTRTPRRFANCTASVPTPPVAPWMISVSPAFSCRTSSMPCRADSPLIARMPASGRRNAPGNVRNVVGAHRHVFCVEGIARAVDLIPNAEAVHAGARRRRPYRIHPIPVSAEIARGCPDPGARLLPRPRHPHSAPQSALRRPWAPGPAGDAPTAPRDRRPCRWRQPASCPAMPERPQASRSCAALATAASIAIAPAFTAERTSQASGSAPHAAGSGPRGPQPARCCWRSLPRYAARPPARRSSGRHARVCTGCPPMPKTHGPLQHVDVGRPRVTMHRTGRCGRAPGRRSRKFQQRHDDVPVRDILELVREQHMREPGQFRGAEPRRRGRVCGRPAWFISTLCRHPGHEKDRDTRRGDAIERGQPTIDLGHCEHSSMVIKPATPPAHRPR